MVQLQTARGRALAGLSRKERGSPVKEGHKAWEGGAWEGGAWEGGAWEGGAWEGGAWEGGAWEGVNSGCETETYKHEW